ncbi:hypothetical protein CC80DRAFT_66195 [Byssothecium circinans]|uniref:Uncharacterized protein n=1 Tax=Byssothecium circinans TaxID=147558 RepID=A0A6A5TVZ3_9PLEO|nr:hypothetical protein CC80DRAFT_66195 [Byssothecium circinans]
MPRYLSAPAIPRSAPLPPLLRRSLRFTLPFHPEQPCTNIVISRPPPLSCLGTLSICAPVQWFMCRSSSKRVREVPLMHLLSKSTAQFLLIFSRASQRYPDATSPGHLVSSESQAIYSYRETVSRPGTRTASALDLEPLTGYPISKLQLRCIKHLIQPHATCILQ